ncbi:MAG: alpha-amylase family glycosyl hydrolase [Nanobdellota archaeon]
MLKLLEKLYGKKAKETYKKINKLIKKNKSKNPLNEKDILLITYPDQIKKNNQKHLKTLNEFLKKTLFTSVHILPFHPYTSDKGFSVKDYDLIKNNLGDWKDINNISKNKKLMADLVLNHTSTQHKWFKDFLKGKNNYYISYEKKPNTKKIFRPRESPLFNEFKINDEKRYILTTFSKDQADLNYKNPEVLLEILKIITKYIEQGIKIIRLDAIGFVWKDFKTNSFCIKKSHNITEIITKFSKKIDSSVKVIAEVNSDKKRNLKFLEEADLVYNFSLPSMLIYSFYMNDCKKLSLMIKDFTNNKKPVLNYLDSHDGIGVSSLKDYISEKENNKFIKKIKNKDFLLGYMKKQGKKKAYEINSTSKSLLGKAFLNAVGVILALKGVPALYLGTLFASKNNYNKFRRTGIRRDVNRSNYTFKKAIKNIMNSETRKILEMIEARKKYIQGKQEIKCFRNILLIKRENVLCFHNFSDNAESINIETLTKNKNLYDIINKKKLKKTSSITLEGYSFIWIILN